MTLLGCTVTKTSVPGSIDSAGLPRTRNSAWPTWTMWSTASPRNARLVTVPRHSFDLVARGDRGERQALRTDRADDRLACRHLRRRLQPHPTGLGLDVDGLAVTADDLARQEVRRADELRDELVVGRLVDLPRATELQHAALLHHRDRGRERQRLDLVVGDVDGGDAELALEPLQLVAQRLAQLGVEVGQRLVEQQQRRLDDDRPGQREALLLATGELGGLAVGEVSELHGLEHLGDAVGDLLLARAFVALAHLQREGDVVEHRHVRPDRVGLEDHAEPALVGRHVEVALPVAFEQRAVADDDPARVRALQAGDGAQRRRLAAARGAEEREHLALADGEADVVDGEHARGGLGPVLGRLAAALAARLTREALDEVLDRQLGRAAGAIARGAGRGNGRHGGHGTASAERFGCRGDGGGHSDFSPTRAPTL